MSLFDRITEAEYRDPADLTDFEKAVLQAVRGREAGLAEVAKRVREQGHKVSPEKLKTTLAKLQKRGLAGHFTGLGRYQRGGREGQKHYGVSAYRMRKDAFDKLFHKELKDKLGIDVSFGRKMWDDFVSVEMSMSDFLKMAKKLGAKVPSREEVDAMLVARGAQAPREKK